MRMIGQTPETRTGTIGRFEPTNQGDRSVRCTLATLTIATTALLLAACGSDTPTNQPAPAAPASTAPETPTAAASPSGPPTLSRWVNVPCSPAGATARTSSGGPLICKQVGSDKTPEWHAVNP